MPENLPSIAVLHDDFKEAFNIAMVNSVTEEYSAGHDAVSFLRSFSTFLEQAKDKDSNNFFDLCQATHVVALLGEVDKSMVKKREVPIVVAALLYEQKKGEQNLTEHLIGSHVSEDFKQSVKGFFKSYEKIVSAPKGVEQKISDPQMINFISAAATQKMTHMVQFQGRYGTQFSEKEKETMLVLKEIALAHKGQIDPAIAESFEDGLEVLNRYQKKNNGLKL